MDGDVMRTGPVTVWGAALLLTLAGSLGLAHQVTAKGNGVPNAQAVTDWQPAQGTPDTGPPQTSTDGAEAPPTGEASEDATTTSLRDGVYSEAQAERGRGVFDEVCGACHMPDEFATAGILVGWDGETVNDLFEAVRMTMPEDNPGGLRRSEYADILAYFFSLNELPAGETEMQDDAGSLESIRIEGLDGQAQDG